MNSTDHLILSVYESVEQVSVNDCGRGVEQVSGKDAVRDKLIMQAHSRADSCYSSTCVKHVSCTCIRPQCAYLRYHDTLFLNNLSNNSQLTMIDCALQIFMYLLRQVAVS